MISCFTSDGLESGIPHLIEATVAFEIDDYMHDG